MSAPFRANAYFESFELRKNNSGTAYICSANSLLQSVANFYSSLDAQIKSGSLKGAKVSSRMIVDLGSMTGAAVSPSYSGRSNIEKTHIVASVETISEVAPPQPQGVSLAAGKYVYIHLFDVSQASGGYCGRASSMSDARNFVRYLKFEVACKNPADWNEILKRELKDRTGIEISSLCAI